MPHSLTDHLYQPNARPHHSLPTVARLVLQVRDAGPKGSRKTKKGRVSTPLQEGIICQICTNEWHPASEFWWRYGDVDDTTTNNTKCAYGVDIKWYMDTGARNHVTGQFNKLQVHEQYHGFDQVRNASGQGREISCISIKFCTPHIVHYNSKISFMFLVLP
jgi:hypothetical protein